VDLMKDEVSPGSRGAGTHNADMRARDQHRLGGGRMHSITHP
jgi:hypothetical protein